MKILKGKTFAKVYAELLYQLNHKYEYQVNARGTSSREIQDIAFTIEDPTSNLYKCEPRSSQEKYIAAELLFYFSGSNQLNWINKFAKFWNQVANKDWTVNSAYGKLIFVDQNKFGITEYQWALGRLLEDKDTRQSLMHFNKPEHQDPSTKDFVCTKDAVFSIRDNKLSLTLSMRSNDAIWGTPTDVAFFTVLQQQMLRHVQTKYPEVTLGSYTHVVNSLHVYNRHYELLDEMLKHQFVDHAIPTLDCDLVDMTGKALEHITKSYERVEQGTATLNPLDIFESLFMEFVTTNINH